MTVWRYNDYEQKLGFACSSHDHVSANVVQWETLNFDPSYSRNNWCDHCNCDLKWLVISLTSYAKLHDGTLNRMGGAEGWNITSLWLFYINFFINHLEFAHNPNGAAERRIMWCLKRVIGVRTCLFGYWLIPGRGAENTEMFGLKCKFHFDIK